MPHHARPTVVLAGWLGCQPRLLRRYESMYHRLGFDVVSRVATPFMVVDASQSSPYLLNPAPNSIQSLAWEVHNLVQSKSYWMFHAFSNGGCFLWEQLRLICQETQGRKPIGVVFDSAPANYYGRDNLSKALSHCTWSERSVIYLQRLWGGTAMERQRQDRARQYWDFLRQDEWDIRQLYLASHDDNLTCFTDLHAMVEERKRVFGNDRIWLREWDSSPHCTHLLMHPEEYQETVHAFVTTCLSDADEKVRSSL